MNLQFSTEELAFRDEVRAWIKEAYDPELRTMMAKSKNGYLDKIGQTRWQKKLYQRGWAAPGWPKEYGGPGWTPTQRYIFQNELSAAGCPPISPMGIMMVAYVIMAFGTEAQKKTFLPATLSSDIYWCQGYSEPGSGSDLASLQMPAVRDGDDYVLNGSKIWTTQAQWADWMFCLVRTSKENKQQNGISFVLIDMRTPGISVRPLPSLDNPFEGDQEVNQVFFENVRVPVENRIGEEGQGWTYAKYLLQFERGLAYASLLKYLLAKVRRLASQQHADNGGLLVNDADFRRRYAELAVKVEALDATEMRFFSSVDSGTAIGAMSSLFKLTGSELQQQISELAVDVVGPDALPFLQDSWAEIRGREEQFHPGPEYAAPIAPLYFNYRKTSIYGGTSEVQRNILAKYVLSGGVV